MPVPFRPELAAFLSEFADRHPGLRRGQMFGLPAVYVGRRLLTCLIEDGIIVRLPDDVARREIRARRAAPYSRRGGKPMGSWVMYTPRTCAEARKLTPTFELAARALAERQVQDLTGVTLNRRRRS